MPVMDGYEANKIIREKEKSSGRHLPIIAITAHALKGDKEKCLEARMDGYISKPIKIPKLIEAIRQAVPERNESKAETAPNDTSSPELILILALGTILKVFGGDLCWFKEIFDLFEEKYKDYIEPIRTAILENDSKGLERAAHSFKSSISFFKISNISKLGPKLEMIEKEEK